MAVTRVGTDSSYFETTTGTNSYDMSHTTPSGASILIVSACMLGNRAFNGVATWDTDDMDLIGETALTSSGVPDVGIWGFVSPAAKTANVNVSWTNASEPFWIAAQSFAGTVTTSVPDATNLVETVTNGATSTTVFASGGSSGNALLVVAGAIGDDMDPASNDAGFTEILDQGTGGGSGINADLCCYIAELLSGLPSAVTITWATSDDNSGMLIELVAASAGTTSDVNYDGIGRGIMRGVARGIG